MLVGLEWIARRESAQVDARGMGNVLLRGMERTGELERCHDVHATLDSREVDAA
jgi:hypothetical protein